MCSPLVDYVDVASSLFMIIKLIAVYIESGIAAICIAVDVADNNN